MVARSILQLHMPLFRSLWSIKNQTCWRKLTSPSSWGVRAHLGFRISVCFFQFCSSFHEMKSGFGYVAELQHSFQWIEEQLAKHNRPESIICRTTALLDMWKDWWKPEAYSHEKQAVCACPLPYTDPSSCTVGHWDTAGDRATQIFSLVHCLNSSREGQLH